MAEYLIIDSNGLVQNVVEWDGVTPWQPAPGYTAEPMDAGEYYEFGKPRGYVPPPPEAEPEGG